jgi:hypothetical protein
MSVKSGLQNIIKFLYQSNKSIEFIVQELWLIKILEIMNKLKK